ncbi:MAG TPA: class I SAM-dependent methyltransferase [Verrucomicrobiae bacterium]|nr:class I SAM-dependent methyltransferase [Verrucomicrobiae bacterium]
MGVTSDVPLMNAARESQSRSIRFVRCNLCGADDFAIVFPKGYAQLHRIVRCNQCGHMYSNPQELVDCERVKADTHSRLFDEQIGGQYFRKQQVQLPDNERSLRVLNGLFPQRGKLLEIGSFCGIFLDRIRADGWDVMGLEPDPGPADYARRKYGLRITDELLPNPALPSGYFDVVVMLHVIEHMPDPSKDLQDIHRMLVPGGVLVVETPRFDSLMFKLFGRRERSLSNCNGHIHFFTVPTLRRVLEKNGFEVIRVDLVGRTLTLDRFLYNVGVMLRHEWIRTRLARLSSALHLDRLRIYVNVHDMQRIYSRAKK